MILDDELDEVESEGAAADGYPVTFIWQLESLEDPKQVGLYKGKLGPKYSARNPVLPHATHLELQLDN